MTRSEVDQLLMPLRLIIAAMAFGIIAFGVLAGVLGGSTADAGLANLLLLILAMFIVAAPPAFFFVRSTLLRQARDWWANEDTQSAPPLTEFVQRYTVIVIIGGALAEAPALFGVLIYLLAGTPLALVAPVLALLAFGRLFPMRSRFNDFVAGVTGLPWDDTQYEG